jgi:hypothetical protein
MRIALNTASLAIFKRHPVRIGIGLLEFNHLTVTNPEHDDPDEGHDQCHDQACH